MKLLVAAAALAAAAVSPHASAQAQQPQGVMYFLPKRDLIVQVTRELTQCGGFDLRVRQSAEILSEPVVEDAERHYLIDIDSLNRFFTGNNMTVNLSAAGAITSVKNQSTDKTAEFIGSVAGAGAKLVAAAAGFPTGLIKAAAADETKELCNKDARDALATANSGPERLEKRTAAVKELKARLEKARADSAEAKQLKAEIAKGEDEIQKLTKDIPLAKAYLRRQDDYRFAARAGRMSMRLDPSSATARAWFSEPGLNGFLDNAASAAILCAGERDETRLACTGWNVVPRALGAYVGALQPAGSSTEYPPSGSDPGGLVYRQPLSAEIRICAARSCIDDKGAAVGRADAGELILLDTRSLPQLGRVGMLPYGKAGIFQSLTVDIEAHETGGVKKLVYTNSARSEKAAEAFSKSIEEIAKLRELKEKEKTQELKSRKDELVAEKEVLEAEYDKLEAEKKLRKAREEAESADK